MKILIVYGSKTGTTKKCAEMLSEKITCENTAVDVKKVKYINIREFDKIVVGSYVRMGQIDKNVKKFCEDNHQVLVEKKASVFVCCGFPQNSNEAINTNFNDKLIRRAELRGCFGGEMDIDKLHGLDKIIAGGVVKILKKEGTRELPHILTENINEFARNISK